MPPPKKNCVAACDMCKSITFIHWSYFPEQFTSTLILFEPKQWTILGKKSLKITSQYRLFFGVFLHPKSDVFPWHLFILMCYLHGTLDEHRLMDVLRRFFYTFFDTWKFKVMQMGASPKIRLNWKVCKQSTGSLGPHNEDFRFSSGRIPLA